MIFKKNYHLIKNFKSLSLILILLLFSINILKFKLGIYFLHDTQGHFEIFKYFSNYFTEYQKFPLWADEITSGTQTIRFFLYLGSFGNLFAALSGLLNLNTLLSFLFLISLYEWVFLIGIYLNIKKNFNIKIFSK